MGHSRTINKKNEKTIVQNLCSFSFKYFGHVRLKEPQNCVPQKKVSLKVTFMKKIKNCEMKKNKRMCFKKMTNF